MLIRLPADDAPCTLSNVDCKKLARVGELLLVSCVENSESKLLCSASSGELEVELSLLEVANGSDASVPPLPVAESNREPKVLETLLLT